MNYSILTAVLLWAFCAFTQVEAHGGMIVIACQTNDTNPEVEVQIEGNEMFYVDFEKKDLVFTMPSFAGKWTFQSLAALGQAEHQACLHYINVVAQAEQNPPEEIDAPQSTIYPMYKAEVGKNNILICFVNNFYPPPVKVKWTRNNVEVKQGVTLSRYYPNKDFTFRQFATVSITPEEGDVYSCTVEHKGLRQPDTKIWEPEFQTESNMAGTAFCGIGLTLGLLGVGVGTFLLIKGNNCD